MKVRFTSIYSSYIKELISLKRGLGYKYITEEQLLLLFDKFVINKAETVVGITKELASEWCTRRENESESYCYHRCSILKTLSIFLCKQGIYSHIPLLPIYKNNFTPHIFTHSEISKIFEACDNFESGNNDLRSSVFSVPAIIRMLYSTGMRIGEVIALRNVDVNLNDNFCILRDTKNGTERLISFSDSLSIVLRQYVQYRSRLPIELSANTTFFVTIIGKPCLRDCIHEMFMRILRLSGIPKGKIRLHDLRHTFAVHSLASMAEQGIDMYANLPILMTYLGHKSLSSTNNYIRLTQEIYPELSQKIDMVCFNVYPKK